MEEEVLEGMKEFNYLGQVIKLEKNHENEIKRCITIGSNLLLGI